MNVTVTECAGCIGLGRGLFLGTCPATVPHLTRIARLGTIRLLWWILTAEAGKQLDSASLSSLLLLFILSFSLFLSVVGRKKLCLTALC